jgi:hypothetical protein
MFLTCSSLEYLLIGFVVGAVVALCTDARFFRIALVGTVSGFLTGWLFLIPIQFLPNAHGLSGLFTYLVLILLGSLIPSLLVARRDRGQAPPPPTA